MIEAADLTDYWSMKSAWVWIILEILQVTQPWRTTMINKISVSCCKIRLKKIYLKITFSSLFLRWCKNNWLCAVLLLLQLNVANEWKRPEIRIYFIIIIILFFLKLSQKYKSSFSANARKYIKLFRRKITVYQMKINFQIPNKGKMTPPLLFLLCPFYLKELKTASH